MLLRGWESTQEAIELLSVALRAPAAYASSVLYGARYSINHLLNIAWTHFRMILDTTNSKQNLKHVGMLLYAKAQRFPTNYSIYNVHF